MRVIVYVASPLHVLSALAAIKTFHREQPVSVTLAVNYPTAGSALLEELHGIVTVMTDRMPLVEACIAVPNEALGELAGRTDVEAAAREFRAQLGLGGFSEIYYFHDVMGVFFAMLAQSYPGARRIAFGDTLGVVFERKFHLSQLGIEVPESIATADPAPNKLSLWERLRTAATRKKASAEHYTDLSTLPFGIPGILPHAAALILPADESGKLLSRIPWAVVQKKLVLELMDALISRCTALGEHVDKLLAGRDSDRKYLLMTENNAEAQFLTFERDIEMYCAIIERHCAPESVIFLKGHPAERLSRYDALRAKIGTKFDLVDFGERFKRYPVEFATRLVRECVPICMAYPTLSLKYLHGIDVIQPMDRAFIKAWYPQKLWDYFDKAHQMMAVPTQRLATWNGAETLWNGAERPLGSTIQHDIGSS
jgi:hypothetical protein